MEVKIIFILASLVILVHGATNEEPSHVTEPEPVRPRARPLLQLISLFRRNHENESNPGTGHTEDHSRVKRQIRRRNYPIPVLAGGGYPVRGIGGRGGARGFGGRGMGGRGIGGRGGIGGGRGGIGGGRGGRG